MVDSIERLREVRTRLVNAGTAVGPDGRSRRLFPVAIGVEEGMALRGWVRKEGAQRTLEVGLGFAISTLFIVEGPLENGSDVKHVATDPYQLKSLPMHRTTYAGVGLQALEEAGVRDRVEFYSEESQIVMPRLLAEGRQLDFVFLDGNHRFEAVFVDLFYSGAGSSRRGALSSSTTHSFLAHGERSISSSQTSAGRGRTAVTRARPTSGWLSGLGRVRRS